MEVLTDLQTVAYNVKATTHRQQQEHAGIHLASNKNTLGMGIVIEQRLLHQKLMFPSNTAGHPTQSHCTVRTTGSQLFSSYLQASPSFTKLSNPGTGLGLTVLRRTKL